MNVYGRSPILGPATSYDTVTCEDGPGWVRSNRSVFSFVRRFAGRTVVLDVVLWNPGFTTAALLSGADAHDSPRSKRTRMCTAQHGLRLSMLAGARRFGKAAGEAGSHGGGTVMA